MERSAGLAEQLALFAQHSPSPEGLRYAEDFITPALEQELIAHVAALPLQPFQFGQFEGKRRVASFGWHYDYGLRRLVRAAAVPDWLNALIGAVAAFGGEGTHVGQVLCTAYDTGVGIGWHRDKPHFERIFGISLGSSCRFRMRRNTGGKWERYSLELAPRSVYLLSGPARHQWEHSIPGVGAPRYSITMRTFEPAGRLSSDHPHPQP